MPTLCQALKKFHQVPTKSTKNLFIHLLNTQTKKLYLLFSLFMSLLYFISNLRFPSARISTWFIGKTARTDLQRLKQLLSHSQKITQNTRKCVCSLSEPIGSSNRMYIFMIGSERGKFTGSAHITSNGEKKFVVIFLSRISFEHKKKWILDVMLLVPTNFCLLCFCLIEQ